MTPGPGGEGGGGVSEDEMWFQVHFAEASVPHIEAIAGQFSVPPQTLGRSDKTSRYIPERPAPSSRARAGIPTEPWRNRYPWNARISFIRQGAGDQAKPAAADLDSGPPRNSPKTKRKLILWKINCSRHHHIK